MSINLKTLSDTLAVASAISPHLRAGHAVLLEGDLGTGKTTFVRALLGVLGVKDIVLSPSFGLAHVYEPLSFTVTHFDLWRIKDASELEELGWHEACYETLVIAEWPEISRKFWPSSFVHIFFKLQDAKRSIKITGCGELSGIVQCL